MRTFDTSIFVSWSGPIEGLADEVVAQIRSRGLRVIKGGQDASLSEREVSDFFPTRILDQMRKETTHAIFLLAPDTKLGEQPKRHLFRDNVMFEAGYLMSYLPTQAAFMFTIGVTVRDLPSDLLGIEAKQVEEITLQDIAMGKTRCGTMSDKNLLQNSAQQICEDVFLKINDRRRNNEDLVRPISAFRDYSRCKAFLRAQIDGTTGPNVLRFASTLLCMATASAYSGESELLLRWCREAPQSIGTHKWESYLRIARNILEWYVYSEGLTSDPPLDELHSFLEQISAWEIQHKGTINSDEDCDLLLLIHTELYKHHVYRRIAMHPECHSEKIAYLASAWNCLEKMTRGIDEEQDPLWEDSKLLWKGFIHFMFCRCWFDMGLPAQKKHEVHSHLLQAIQARLIVGDRLASQDNDVENERLAKSYKLETLTNIIFEMVHWSETLDRSKITRIAKALEVGMPQNQGWSRLLNEFRRDIPKILGEEGARIVGDTDLRLSSELLSKNRLTQRSH